MSALAGVLAFGPAPEDRDGRDLATMAEALAERGPDGCSQARLGGATMVWRPFHTTPESRAEPQPLRAPDLLLAWDGRLDNRRQLAALLPSSGAGAGTGAGEAELVAAAYRRWGEDCAAHLVGDFAFALWDEERRRLLLARDAFGLRPLYFAATDRRLLWASAVPALRAAGAGGGEVDDLWVAGFLTSPFDLGRSPWRGIEAVPPGHSLVFSAGSRRERRFWPREPAAEVRLAGDGEYEERFRELFAEAVSSRLRGEGAIFAELSGGVDSSSIVCVADALLRRDGGAAPRLHTVSFVFDRAASSDERPFIHQVEARIGRPRHHILEDDHPALAELDRPASPLPDSLSCHQARYRRLARLMEEHGARVLLSGIGGDQLLWSEVGIPFHLADLLREGRLRELAGELPHWQRTLRFPYLKLLWRAVLAPLLPRATSAAARGTGLPAWLEPGFARRLELPARLRAAAWPVASPSPTRRERHGAVAGAVEFCAHHLHQAPLPIEWRLPYLHRPLVEFCLGIPFEQLMRRGETRSLHRRALAPYLPPAIAARRDKRGPDEAMMRALAREWPLIDRLMGDDARVYARGYIRRQAFRQALERARAGLPERVGTLFLALSLEVWLRSLDGGGGAAGS